MRTFKRLRVGDVEVVASAEKVFAHFPVKSKYPLLVDGVLRGYLCFQQPGYMHHHDYTGWCIRNLLPWSDGAHGIIVARSSWPAARAAAELLAKVPDLITSGDLPTAEEAQVVLDKRAAEAAAREAAASAREAAEAARRARTDRDIQERREELHAGLLSLAERSDLTNLERAGLREAMSRLGVRAQVAA